eukprot:COSAG03_NODE_1544_length_3904_cov_4.593167_1_plen_332_part_00
MANQGLDCEYRVGGYLSLAYEDTEDAEGVGIHAEDDTTEYWDPAKVKAALGGAESFDRRKIAGGMFKRDAGHVWPAKLVQTLAKACTQTSFCTRTVALSLSPGTGSDRGRVCIETNKGTIVTGKVCICTNGWAPNLLPVLGASGAIYPVRNNVLMTAPTRTWAWAGSVSVPSTDTNEYMYCMRRPDGRLVIGGRHDSARSDDDSVGSDHCNAAARMKDFLAELLANFGEELVVEKEWAGVKGYTTDGKPIVGELPQQLLHDGLRAGTVFAGVGFNGHGCVPRRTLVVARCAVSLRAPARPCARRAAPDVRLSIVPVRPQQVGAIVLQDAGL